ncbi:cadherin [Culex quinquefasciatus]|uniref:Cadherin n=1 Tax=Culex quinquefasciatus TaxID=7176 RepID=B0WCX6_CULQU|nr:cadherin [Culex quinquefasciatus]|eukprot:XP_001846560.1 cadherin [Culex quinquefasciatus]
MTKEELAPLDAAVTRTGLPSRAAPPSSHKRIERRRRRLPMMSSRTRSPWFLLLAVVLMVTQAQAVDGKLQLCEVETGQTNIILDIEESRGSFVGQRTTPPELPIYGEPDEEIALDLIFPKGKPTFTLVGKSLQLIHPLDRDEENLSHIVFQITCTIRSTRRKRNIPIIVRVSDVNDNPPMFINTPYETTVPEVSVAST